MVGRVGSRVGEGWEKGGGGGEHGRESGSKVGEVGSRVRMAREGLGAGEGMSRVGEGGSKEAADLDEKDSRLDWTREPEDKTEDSRPGRRHHITVAGRGGTGGTLSTKT
ncbi:hypothetical protein Pcinc_038192 [Petrolisthes cinctipes]|uniref:Uncharacterized protein n=1 Tax=Petrolisthes cinctipes TaxID=88211 RepID=A0AAE1ELU5_PETCI|nr:hypothetical protein Pcinc_038192 [Petrolisthes cinctipes]